MGLSKVTDVVTPLWPLVTSRPLFCGFNQQDAKQDFSVWPFQSRDFLVLVVSVSRHFGQTEILQNTCMFTF